MIKKTEIKVGLIVHIYDEDDDRWFKAKIIEISLSVGEQVVILEDIDPDSMWQGITWSCTINDIMNPSICRK